MALQVANVDVKKLELTLKDPLIDKEFKQNYKEIYALVHNRETKEGIIKALCATGAIKGGSGKVTLDAKNAGQNHEHTWKEYGKKIKTWLEKHVNGDAMFETAREVLAKHIYHQHWLKYPRWPGCAANANQGVNEAQSIVVDVKGKYPYNDYTLIWAGKGEPFVKDICKREGPNSFSYYTEVWGDLELKVLSLDRWKLEAFNKEIEGNPAAWRQRCINFKDPKYSISYLNDAFAQVFGELKL